MSIIEIITSITDHGLSFVISGIFLYVVIKFINLGFSKFTKTMNNKQHDKLLAMRAEIDEEANTLIHDFLVAHHGTRVQIVEFTNSVMSVAYLPFKYMSCTYEVIAYGNKTEAKRIDKLSTSLFSPFISKMSRQTTLLLDDTEATSLSGAVHDIFQGLGSTYQLCAILRTQKDKAIGFVTFGTEKEIQEQDITDIKILASQLSALLGVLDK